MAVMIDLRGSSANMENPLRTRSGPANKLKETVQLEANWAEEKIQGTKSY